MAMRVELVAEQIVLSQVRGAQMLWFVLVLHVQSVVVLGEVGRLVRPVGGGQVVRNQDVAFLQIVVREHDRRVALLEELLQPFDLAFVVELDYELGRLVVKRILDDRLLLLLAGRFLAALNCPVLLA